MRIHNNLDMLAARVMKVKHKGSSLALMNMMNLKASSWGFGGMYIAVRECMKGFIQLIGNGYSTKIMS